MIKNEIWCDILNYEGLYQVSNMGNIRSIDRYVICKNGRQCFKKGCLIAPFQGTTCNYLSTTLCKENVTKKFLIHRLVAQAFLGLDTTSEMEVNHKDGNRHNNCVDNLEVVTHQQNIDHSVATNLKQDYGEQSTNSKLTNAQAAEIRELWNKGVKQVDLAKAYHVCKQCICNIVHNKTYFR